MGFVGLVRSSREDALRVRPRRRRVRLTPYGVAARVDLGCAALTADDLRDKRGGLESSFRAVGSRVMEAGPGWVRLDLRHTDPQTRPIGTTDLPPPTRAGYVVVGLDEDGIGVEKELRLPSLIVGAQGSGKSNEAWTTLDALQRAGIPFRLRVFDPKGGQEFSTLAGVVHRYESDPLKWGEFLASALGGLMKRQAVLAKRGIRELHTFTAENPLDLMIVDELVTVLLLRGRDKVRVRAPGGDLHLTPERALMMYLSQARAAGYSMLALTQIGTKDVIGPVRALFGYATVLRVSPMEEEMINVVLGHGAAARYPAHTLPAGRSMAGIGYVDTGTARGIVRYRAARLSDAKRQAVARRLAAAESSLGQPVDLVRQTRRRQRHEESGVCGSRSRACLRSRERAAQAVAQKSSPSGP